MASLGRSVLDPRKATRLNQIFRYILVGLFNTGLGYLVIFSSMYLFGLDPLISNILGYATGLVFSYFLNRIFTFRSNQKKSSEFFLFVFFFLIAYGMNFLSLYLLVHFTNLHQAISQILSGIIYIVCSFLLQKFVVYKPKVIVNNK
jgi:putative flippase GtrA